MKAITTVLILTAILITARAETIYQCDLTEVRNGNTGLSDVSDSKDFLRYSSNNHEAKFSYENNKVYTWKFVSNEVTNSGVKFKMYGNNTGAFFAIYSNNHGVRLLGHSITMDFVNCTKYIKGK